ncbi:hypothetical protein OF83DRAFT_1080241 [Amylostereum chailletii]|nr:hypothetical protein OF83DRAFT_1080241 [Amylostereum chailletii]
MTAPLAKNKAALNSPQRSPFWLSTLADNCNLTVDRDGENHRSRFLDRRVLLDARSPVADSLLAEPSQPLTGDQQVLSVLKLKLQTTGDFWCSIFIGNLKPHCANVHGVVLPRHDGWMICTFGPSRALVIANNWPFAFVLPSWWWRAQNFASSRRSVPPVATSTVERVTPYLLNIVVTAGALGSTIYVRQRGPLWMSPLLSNPTLRVPSCCETIAALAAYGHARSRRATNARWDYIPNLSGYLCSSSTPPPLSTLTIPWWRLGAVSKCRRFHNSPLRAEFASLPRSAFLFPPFFCIIRRSLVLSAEFIHSCGDLGYAGRRPATLTWLPHYIHGSHSVNMRNSKLAFCHANANSVAGVSRTPWSTAYQFRTLHSPDLSARHISLSCPLPNIKRGGERDHGRPCSAETYLDVAGCAVPAIAGCEADGALEREDKLDHIEPYIGFAPDLPTSRCHHADSYQEHARSRTPHVATDGIASEARKMGSLVGTVHADARKRLYVDDERGGVQGFSSKVWVRATIGGQ